MGSHSVTCHPAQVNAPRLNPNQILDLPTTEGWKAELTLMTYRPTLCTVVLLAQKWLVKWVDQKQLTNEKLYAEV